MPGGTQKSHSPRTYTANFVSNGRRTKADMFDHLASRASEGLREYGTPGGIEESSSMDDPDVDKDHWRINFNPQNHHKLIVSGTPEKKAAIHDTHSGEATERTETERTYHAVTELIVTSDCKPTEEVPSDHTALFNTAYLQDLPPAIKHDAEVAEWLSQTSFTIYAEGKHNGSVENQVIGKLPQKKFYGVSVEYYKDGEHQGAFDTRNGTEYMQATIEGRTRILDEVPPWLNPQTDDRRGGKSPFTSVPTRPVTQAQSANYVETEGDSVWGLGSAGIVPSEARRSEAGSPRIEDHFSAAAPESSRLSDRGDLFRVGDSSLFQSSGGLSAYPTATTLGGGSGKENDTDLNHTTGESTTGRSGFKSKVRSIRNTVFSKFNRTRG